MFRCSDRQLRFLHHATVTGGPINARTGDPTPWWTCARDEQLPPESLYRDKLIWVVLAGRGFGKTRSGAEWLLGMVEEIPGGRFAIVAKDPGEARDVMIEGSSGILACSPVWDVPNYEPSKKRITWRNGTQASVFSSEDFEELRGPQHHAAWCDELPKWRNAAETWDQLMFGMRLGERPRICVTSTPRPVPVLKAIMENPLTVVTRGRTRDNLINLSPLYESVIRKYEGTRLGRQELDAEILDDIPGALWSYTDIDRYRLWAVPDGVGLARIVVAIDPSITEEGTEAGIVAAAKGTDGRGYVLADRTMTGRPEAWARQAIDLLRLLHGDCIIAEINQGGQMVEATLRQFDRSIPYRAVSASRGKITRAEPISLLYERGLISHVGSFPELEDEMCTYQETDMTGKKQSPNRMDAMVWALTELFEKPVASLADGIVIGEESRALEGFM